MGIYLNPESERFQKSLHSEIYIDKSELIHKTNEVLNTEQRYICVSRPRRFGKSMALNMLSAYYGCGEDTDMLFRNLKINTALTYKNNLNKYDVIAVNMQEFLSGTGSINDMLEKLKKYIIFDLMEIIKYIWRVLHVRSRRFGNVFWFYGRRSKMAM